MGKLKISGIEIDVIRKSIKNLHLGVYPPNGRVRIAAPLSASNEALRLFAISKLTWIKKQQLSFINQVRQSEREFLSGESHYFQGKRYLLNVIESNKNKVEIKNKKNIDLYVKKGSNIFEREKIMIKWYRKNMREVSKEIIEIWEKKLDVTLTSYNVRVMKTKWGSCNSEKKRISLNLELIKTPVECIEYIIVHELIHLFEKKHNELFVAYMDKYLPNWRTRKKELNKIVFESSKWKY